MQKRAMQVATMQMKTERITKHRKPKSKVNKNGYVQKCTLKSLAQAKISIRRGIKKKQQKAMEGLGLCEG